MAPMMSAVECRLALERLDAELVEELGVRYPASERFRELLSSTGETPSDRERALVGSHRKLMALANEILGEWDARQP